MAKSTIRHSFFILSLMTKSGHLACITWSVCILKSHRIVMTLFSTVVSSSCSYHLVFTSNPYFRQTSQWLFFQTKSCCRLNSLCVILLLKRCFTVSSACLLDRAFLEKTRKVANQKFYFTFPLNMPWRFQIQDGPKQILTGSRIFDDVIILVKIKIC